MAPKTHDDDCEEEEDEKEKKTKREKLSSRRRESPSVDDVVTGCRRCGDGDPDRPRGTSSSDVRRKDGEDERKSRDDADREREKWKVIGRRGDVEVLGRRTSSRKKDATRKKRRENDDNDNDEISREHRLTSKEAADAKTSTSSRRRLPPRRMSSDDLALLKQERDRRQWTSSDGKGKISRDDADLEREEKKGRERREGWKGGDNEIGTSSRKDTTLKMMRKEDDNDNYEGGRERQRPSNEAVHTKTSTSSRRRLPPRRMSSDDLEVLKTKGRPSRSAVNRHSMSEVLPSTSPSSNVVELNGLRALRQQSKGSAIAESNPDAKLSSIRRTGSDHRYGSDHAESNPNLLGDVDDGKKPGSRRKGSDGRYGSDHAESNPNPLGERGDGKQRGRDCESGCANHSAPTAGDPRKGRLSVEYSGGKFSYGSNRPKQLLGRSDGNRQKTVSDDRYVSDNARSNPTLLGDRGKGKQIGTDRSHSSPIGVDPRNAWLSGQSSGGKSSDDGIRPKNLSNRIRKHSSDGLNGKVNYMMKERGLYPSKSRSVPCRRRRETHTGSFLRREELLLGIAQRRRETNDTTSSAPASVGDTAAVIATAVKNTTPSGQTTSEMTQTEIGSPQQWKIPVSSRIKNRSQSWLYCMILILLLAVAVLAAYLVLQSLGKAPTMPSFPHMTTETTTVSPAASSANTLLDSYMPSCAPSIVPTKQHRLDATEEQQLLNNTEEHPLISNTAPTHSPFTASDATIAIVVQLDGKPEETGFFLISAENSTTYISRPVGSLSNMHSQVVTEFVTIPKRTELVFTFEDASGDGLCCTHGDGYYRVFSGTGGQKTTIVSGEQAGKYVFTVGVQQVALQIDGVDPNENCKPCPTGKDCGRCAWCEAQKGFMPDTIFSYQCHSSARPIPKKCWIGEKRFQLHNQYVVAMAGCAEGSEPWPQVKTSNGTKICVQEAKCIKSYPFSEPNCNQEYPGSLLVKETCQDKIGGIPFGYSWALNSPREKECSKSTNFTKLLASRCCVDGVAFCDKADQGQETMAAPSPSPIEDSTLSPTSSYPPTWDGHHLTFLIQLDDFPQETGFSITSMVNGENVTFIHRQEGYYKQPHQLVVEKVRIPEGGNAIITLTDKEGDGFCCLSGDGYFQVYSAAGSVILDNAGVFETFISKSFYVVAVQLDQWSGETGLSLESYDGETFFDWPTGNFTEIPSSLFIETVSLPNASEVTLKVTDTGGDGFCCLYGDGFIKIFAGESAEDESALLAFKSAEFESELQINFRVGPAPTVSPAMTSKPSFSNETASTGPTSSSPPSMDGFLVTLVLQLDEFSAETAWSIDSSDGMTSFSSRPFGYYKDMKSHKVIETIRLPEGLEYQFKIVDFMGDGTCCWAGNGWYDLYQGGDSEDEDLLIFHGNGDVSLFLMRHHSESSIHY
ncbi:hypothetical protein ACHAXA_006475 [Cyclostephanos tholiformis]|uniref:Uncharacterized protein n=1 Tax=Cyclostephanos tholiformis TaxID=382380 RepID=A0ABD3RZI2_9STRA